MKKVRILVLMLLSILMVTGCAKKSENVSDHSTQNNGSLEETSDQKDTKNEENTSKDNNSGETPAEKIGIKVAALKGPTAIGMVQIMENSANKAAANDYEFTIAGVADEITAGLIKGDFDIAAVPCNLASVLFNKTEGKIKLAAINTLSVLYIVETGNEIHKVEDLKGKTIYSTGFGTTPQYTLNYLLNSYGIDPEKDVTIEYKTEATEVAALLKESTNAIAMLPQPYVTTVMMENSSVRIALDVAKEWDAVSKDGSSVVTGVVVAREEFLTNHPEAFETFMKEYQDSTEFVNGNVDEAAGLVEKHGIFKAAVAKQAIPYCNITFIKGEEMKGKVEGYLKTLFDQNPQAVGGKLPGSVFYYGTSN